MTEILLKAEKLKKVFTAGKNSFAAVDEVSFELKRGQCLGIVGESGSGKSTVARLITGLLPCTEGKVLFYPSSEGTEAGCIDISQAGIRQLKQAYRHMQMVFQMPAESFDPRRTLGDGIGESLRNMGIKGTELKTKVDNLLELCGLTPEFASRYPHQVSGGQCQRAAIARALRGSGASDLRRGYQRSRCNCTETDYGASDKIKTEKRSQRNFYLS